MEKRDSDSVGFLTSGRADDRKAFSGVSYYCFQSMKKYFDNLYPIAPVHSKLFKPIDVAGYVLRRLTGIRFTTMHTLPVSLEIGKKLGDRLRKKGHKAILAMAASSEIAHLDPDCPLVYSTDSTYAALNNYYPKFSNLWNLSVKQGNIIEKRAINNARLLLYPSRWAAESAIRDYGASPEKIHVFPYGANLDNPPPAQIAQQRHKGKKCRLLFIGVDWERKGGRIAVDTLRLLQKRGVDAELTVCGCKVPDECMGPSVINPGFIDKGTDEGRNKLDKLFTESDFFFMPTRFECLGIVFAEASAFGLPIISTDTGGVSGMVTEGINGCLLPFDAGADGYAKLIAEIYGSDERYYGLVESSRKEYEMKLNWDVWAKKTVELIGTL